MKKNLFIIPLLTLFLASCGGGGTPSQDTSSEDPSSPEESSKTSETSSQTSQSSSTKKEENLPAIDYVKLYAPKEYNYIYIWDGNNHPLGEWPGKTMSSFDSDWNTYDMKSLSSFKVIFHDNKGNQTGDLSLDGNGHYFCIDDVLSKRTTLPTVEEQEYDLPDNKDAYRNFYQLLVYSFADSNGDGIGDFKGIANKLDYLVDLGIESIWLSPINKCVSYHAYDVTDYYEVNPEYIVNNYGLENLVTDAHAKGIQIILDLVLNHTSNQHKWYSEHPSWYSGDNVFGDSMPDLNFDKQEVREEIKNVGRYWLDKGVDGFRLDAAMWIYSTKTNINQHKKNYTWWNEWCGAMREKKSDVYIVAEVLNKNHNLAYDYAQGGFNSTFDFEAMKHVYNAVKDPTYDYVGKTLTDMAKAYKYNPNYCLARPLSNHDVGRFTSSHNSMEDADAYYLTTVEDLRLANSLNILTPGNTFLYYGDELGLQGKCPTGWDDMNYRTPMPFSSGRTDSTKYFHNFKGNGATTSTTLSGKTIEQDQADSNSIYTACSKLLNLKIKHPTLKNGTMKALTTTLPSGLKGYSINGSENIAIVYNPTSNGISYTFTGNNLYASNGNTTNSFTIPSKGVVVYSY